MAIIKQDSKIVKDNQLVQIENVVDSQAKADIAEQNAKAYTDQKIAQIPAPPVTSVNGKTGAVSLGKGDVGLGNVDNVKQATKTEFDNHVGAGGTAHAVATTSVAGFMSAADKTKLDGIQAGAQVNLVKHYEEGEWTPELTFGGASAGSAGAFNFGRYTRIGNMVFIDCWVHLSTKGSSTGEAVIKGLPFTPRSILPSLGVTRSINVTFPTGKTSLVASVHELSFGIRLNAEGSGGGETILKDSHFSNGSQLLISIAYLI